MRSAIVGAATAIAVTLCGGTALVTRSINRSQRIARTAKVVAPLPVEPQMLGSESSELARLCHSGEPSGPRPSALFPQQVPNRAGYRRPEGLHRVEWDAAVEATGPFIAYLVENDAGHRTLLEAIKRSGRYRSEVLRILRVWQVPEDLSAIAFVESGFSQQGGGLWSLTPQVAEAYGLVMTPSYDERRGVEAATEVAARYLADLHERLGSWDRAVCAFNTGYAVACSEAAGDAVNATGSTDPKQCGSYFIEVTAVAVVLANRSAFHLDDLREDEPILTSDLEVPAGAPLRLVARAAGTSVGRLKELNPEYGSEIVPNTGVPMFLHLPAEGLARAKEMLVPLLYATPGSGLSQGPVATSRHLDSARPAESQKYYRVREGDTFEGLVTRLGVDRNTLASNNALDPASSLRVGQLLVVSSTE